MKIASSDEIRLMDRHAIDNLGIAEEILMENAGMAAFSLLRNKIGVRGRKFIIFCGSGNNGGDGLVLARMIHSGGGIVKVFLLGDSDRYKGAAKTNYGIITKLPVEVVKLKNASNVKKDLAHCEAVVDAIFGTGLDRSVTGLVAEIITLINRSKKKILSLDIPSGINGNTGEVMEVAVKADYTVTFGLPKIGNMLYPGYERGGELFVSHISFPPSLIENSNLTIATNYYIKLPARPAEAHKGTMGDVLFIAGALNYYGAPYFAAMSFLKTGGGYSRLAAPCSVVPVIARQGREIVYLPQKETSEGSLSLSNKKGLLAAAAKVDMIVIGPGLSLQEETRDLVKELTGAITKPIIIDGDGLTAVADNPGILRRRKAETILTPHMGEMARLTGKSAAQISTDKIAILRETAQKLKSTIILKGAHSLIGTTDGNIYINLSGNAGMATAGSGDVLAGCVAAMYGMGLSVNDAARKGVFIHGYAGDLAAVKKGIDGITAKDIMKFLPEAMKHDREGIIDAKYYAPLCV
ncbi:MAG: NAD(P)H-hydrate dehydratase [Syntrophaceae bacterium]|nr:NAD(P)H-hydrate dehydratase [Syntrophaceae bacterium]